MPVLLQGLQEIALNYDGFILDLWGVVHDGVKPFPDTIPTLKVLQAAGKRVWLLSNAPRRSAVVAEKLLGMGITPDLYNGLLTSGESSHQALKNTYLKQWGKRCFHVGTVADQKLYAGLDVTLVSSPQDADFFVVTGVEDFADPLEKYLPILQDCAKRQLPMLCANPDKIVHVAEQLVICAGSFADAYTKMGGEVTYFGKPHRGVYTECLANLNVPRVVAVGDSLWTDIQGAVGAGIDSILVTSGIHREEHDKADFLNTYPWRPNYMMPWFKW